MTEVAPKLNIGMTAEDIENCRTAWCSKLRSALMGAGRTHSEILSVELEAAVTAIQILDRINPQTPADVKKKREALATPLPTGPRPTKGPYAPTPGSPEAIAQAQANPKATLPPPGTS